MDQSLTLVSAQVHFLDTELALIHIPLHLYNFFVQPILHMLSPPNSRGGENVDQELASNYDHTFLNISVTPVECSVVCSRTLANELFTPVRDSLEECSRKQVTISKDNYIVMQVDGEGLDAGQRVVELTSPLAMNKIPLFFISTYFSDYILFPQPSRTTVIAALEARGFALESQTESFVNITSPFGTSISRLNNNSTISSTHLENPFTKLSITDHHQRPPPTPPPSTLEELQTRTFATLKNRNILPRVDPSIRLIQCAERRPTSRGGGSNSNRHTTSSSTSAATKAARASATMRMQLSLMKCLIGYPRPKFFSLTLTDTEAASLLFERRLLPNFGGVEPDGVGVGGGMGDLLLGDPEEVLVPIILDLRDLPMESTGIVCGVAGRLVNGGGGSSHHNAFTNNNNNTTTTTTTPFFPPNASNSNSNSNNGYYNSPHTHAQTNTYTTWDDDLPTPSPTAAIPSPDLRVLEMSYLSTARAGAVIVAEGQIERALGALGRGR